MTARSTLRIRSVPVTGARATAGAVATRARWLWACSVNPALRGAPRIQLGRGGEWSLRRGASLRIGRGVTLAAHYYVMVQGDLAIGTAFFANRNFYLSCMGSIVIGDNVRFGERVSVHDENHLVEYEHGRRDEQRDLYDVAPIVVGDDAWVGANCVLLGGCSIGARTVVAANSVVTGALPNGVLAAGAPAKVIRDLET